jgi:hypothetical protein
MPQKVPIINGKTPDEQYDLDNKSDLQEIGLNSEVDIKVADKYVHYRNCKYAVIEFKGSTLRKAIIQLEITVKRLLTTGRKVDFAIIVMDRLSRWEKRIFKRRRDRTLIDPQTNKPYTIRVGSLTKNILLFYSSEVRKMYSGLNKYLSGGNN